ncbi:MAG: hypothetical protein JW863_20225 [Chitinispirillaceae bacterium]|nr:hypothetical protein [Chitinispirillaceae bacterium]
MTLKPAPSLPPLRVYGVLTIVLACSGALFSLDIPALYQCNAVRLTQVKNGKTYSKAFLVRSLFIKFDRREIRVFGMHGNMYVCQKLGIRRFFADTLFLEKPENAPVRHSDPKLYMVKDTLLGNVNLFESDTSEVSIKVLVKKLIRHRPTDLEKRCR